LSFKFSIISWLAKGWPAKGMFAEEDVYREIIFWFMGLEKGELT
jgi:hypothetical protein